MGNTMGTGNVYDDDAETLQFADESEYADEPADDFRPVSGPHIAVVHGKWLDLGLPAHTWPAFLARSEHEHAMAENRMSDCAFGCKVFRCPCGAERVRHMASYGCPQGKCACPPLPANAGIVDVNRGHLLGCPALRAAAHK